MNTHFVQLFHLGAAGSPLSYSKGLAQNDGLGWPFPLPLPLIPSDPHTIYPSSHRLPSSHHLPLLTLSALTPPAPPLRSTSWTRARWTGIR